MSKKQKAKIRKFTYTIPNPPKQISGTVIATEYAHDPFYGNSRSMTISWLDGTESKMPMPCFVLCGDRLVFTISHPTHKRPSK